MSLAGRQCNPLELVPAAEYAARQQVDIINLMTISS